MSLAGGFNQILEMGTGQEVSEVDEFAVILILHIDDAPSILATADLLATNDNGFFRAHDGKWDNVLDLGVDCTLLVIKLIVVIREHLEVVEYEFLPDSLLEDATLLESERVRLGDDRHHIDDIRQLLQDDDIDGFESVTRGLNKEEATVDSRVLDVPFSLRSELFPQVGRVLVLDVLDNGIPASVIVDLVSVSGGIDNVQAQTNTILLDYVRDGLDLSSRANRLIRSHATLGIDEVRRKDGIDECRLAQSRLTDTDDIELEPALQQLLLNLRCDAVEADVTARIDRLGWGTVKRCHCDVILVL